MSNTQSKPFGYHAIQPTPTSSPQAEAGPSANGAAMDPNPSDNDLLRAIQCVSVWINRHRGSDELVVAMKAIEARLDEILERLSQDRMSGQLMSVKAAAQFLSLSERTIRERIAIRQWPAYRSGNAVRVDPLELRALMQKEFR